MTTTTDRTAAHDLATDFPARLSLTPKTTLAGQLDGAWWPRSRDLTVELPPLAAALDEVWGRITRVTVNPTRWPVIPHKVPVAGHTVQVGWFTEQHPDKLILRSLTVGRWDLLVIPPETEPASAARLMTAASLPGSTLTAGTLMANEAAISALPGSTLTAGTLMANEAAISRDVIEARNQENAWETEGGACTSPFGHPSGRMALPVPGNTWR
ncbi:hypothetical protein HYE82_05575 [Streptomyces sp. BR123]|uniref:DUF5994 family protein n=1 Tax=Streptomyces sp. BR123 TaxID=2749828 RepID=UPI0015C4551F|nr:DUF5994 family protein [Streptomyces sp. BR123]NXY93871.1 hypothetical protein [Streptomyces sp. BR123]